MLWLVGAALESRSEASILVFTDTFRDSGGWMGLAIFLPVQIFKQVVEFPFMCQILFHLCSHFIFVFLFFSPFRFLKGGSVDPILQSGQIMFPRSHGFYVTKLNKYI